MRRITMIIGALTLLAAGCSKKNEAKQEQKTEAPKPATPDPAPAKTPDPAPVAAADPAPAAQKKLFMDVHELGKVSAKDVAEAHKKDLATQGKHGVEYKAYWVDEKNGKVYCLSEAPSAEAASTVHKEAHGLVPTKVMEVTADNTSWTPTPGAKLYMDVHNIGAGKVTPDALAEAHKKDLAVEGKHKVKYINYWLNQDTGTVMCLAEAPDSGAAVSVHKEAHGLVADTIAEVTEGR